MLKRSTFSIARFLMLPPSWPRQVGQQVSLGLQLEQTRWPAWHWGRGVKKMQDGKKVRVKSLLYIKQDMRVT